MTSCATCNAPMAADQRYCLNCGARGGEARLPFLDILRADEQTQVVPYGQPLPPGTGVGGPVAALPPPPLTTHERLRANSGLIAGVGVLLLAMLIGVLIGSGLGNDSPQAVAAPPTVISVGGGAPAAAPTGATGATGTTDTSAAPDSSASGGASSSSTKKSSSSSSSSSSATTSAPAKATNSAVKNLDKLTGKDAQKAADKLGKTIATGGKAPKKDSKPAAAGGGFQDIG